MDKTGRGFPCVRNKFPNVSDAKINEGIFIGPQVREVMQDKKFGEDLNETKINAWLSFKRICKDFLGSHKAANCQDVVQDLLTSYKTMGSNMSLKIHFLESHLNFFPQKISAKSVTNTVKYFTKTFWLWKSGTKASGLQYVGRLLVDTEEGCIWSQLPAKVISLYILEVTFCMFHQYVKYYFTQIKFSVSLKSCLIEKFCIHIWIQQKKYC